MVWFMIGVPILTFMLGMLLMLFTIGEEAEEAYKQGLADGRKPKGNLDVGEE